MLFTAPAFLFLFLPLVLLLYAICGKERRRVCLLVICGAYHLFANLFHLQTLLMLVLLIVYTYLAGLLIRRLRRPVVTTLACLLPYVALVALRGFAYAGAEGFIYPVGLTVTTMASTSYLLDTTRSEASARHRVSDVFLYLSFFPTMLVGPFIQYHDFLELTREDRICFDVSNFADGARLYMTGFIKRIAVGAILMETYDAFLSSLTLRSDLLVTLFAMILIYFGVYFTVSGYADMGCGLTRMFGIRLSYASPNPFRAALPDQYGRGLFFGFYGWLDDYLVEPLNRCAKGRHAHLIRAIAYGGVFLLLLRTTRFVLLLAIPVVALSYLSSRFQWEHKLKKCHGVRILTGFLTMTVISLGWICMTVGDPVALLRHLAQMSFYNSEYYLNVLLVTFSGVEYLFVLFVALFLTLPVLYAQRKGLGQCETRTHVVMESVGTLLLLLLFAFSILFFLPQHEGYHSVPFRYMFI